MDVSIALVLVPEKNNKYNSSRFQSLIVDFTSKFNLTYLRVGWSDGCSEGCKLGLEDGITLG